MQISKRVHDFSLNPEIMTQPFTLCLQWERFADKMSALNQKRPAYFPHLTTAQPGFQRFCSSLAFIWRFFRLTSSLPSLPVLQTSLIFGTLILCLYVWECFWGLFLSFTSFFFIFCSSMYIYGGFSGPLLNDVLVYTPPSCLAFPDPAACAAAGPGVRCHWVSSGCRSWEPEPPEQTVPAVFCRKPAGMLSMSFDSNRLWTSF